jgi:hypothetical protein
VPLGMNTCLGAKNGAGCSDIAIKSFASLLGRFLHSETSRETQIPVGRT